MFRNVMLGVSKPWLLTVSNAWHSKTKQHLQMMGRYLVWVQTPPLSIFLMYFSSNYDIHFWIKSQTHMSSCPFGSLWQVWSYIFSVHSDEGVDLSMGSRPTFLARLGKNTCFQQHVWLKSAFVQKLSVHVWHKWMIAQKMTYSAQMDDSYVSPGV